MQEISEDKIQEVSDAVLEHMMNPKNYGVMKDAQYVGMSSDEVTGEYALIYLKIDDKLNISDVTFGCNACQDTVVAGSIFTQMIKGASLEYANKAEETLKQKLKNAPKKQQACTNLILLAFDAAKLHKDKPNNEDMYILKVEQSCEEEQ